MGTISVSNLGKAYKQYPSRWSRLMEWLDPKGRPQHQLKWVLQDINFTVNAGEAVGIIGINGAGKSTLLKLITGTTQPTTGNVRMAGRVAAMLELGMGFHPDFTGRQNAFMASQLLGITSEEITRLMPEIEAFAEISDYIDQPVRVYSSGMQMRLAFSVATAIRPDVLIVDEALSVGDAYFQHKSFDRIREFRKQGTTLLIVSHDKSAIQSICDRAILLADGKLAMEGEPEAVMDYYNAMLANGQKDNLISTNTDGLIESSGNGDAIINEVSVKNQNGDCVTCVNVGDQVVVEISVSVKKNIDSLVLGCGFKDRLGQMIFGTNTYYLGGQIKNCRQGENYIFLVECAANLGVGTYSISVAIHAEESHLIASYHWIDRAALLEVVNPIKHEFVGVSWNQMRFSINKICNDNVAKTIFEMPSEEIKLAQTSYGSMLVYGDDQVIGKSLIQTGSFQEAKISEVTNFIKNKFEVSLENFLDIGANIGTHTVYALKKCGFKKAIAIEPNIENYQLLCANISINGLTNLVITKNLAISNFYGKSQMELSKFNRGDHRIKAKCLDISFGEELEREYEVVPTIPIDGLLDYETYNWKKTLVWIDTQGHEGFIYDGGKEFFSRKTGINYVVSEFWPYGIERASGFEKYFEFLDKCKKIYDLNVIVNSNFLEISSADLRKLYIELLETTEKEKHPHTDLLLVIS